jgi:hypothetical protein
VLGSRLCGRNACNSGELLHCRGPMLVSSSMAAGAERGTAVARPRVLALHSFRTSGTIFREQVGASRASLMTNAEALVV